MKAESFSEHGWRRYDIKKEKKTCQVRTCEIYDRTATRRKGWTIVYFIRLDLKFCFLSHVLKELTVVVVVLKIV